MQFIKLTNKETFALVNTRNIIYFTEAKTATGSLTQVLLIDGRLLNTDLTITEVEALLLANSVVQP